MEYKYNKPIHYGFLYLKYIVFLGNDLSINIQRIEKETLKKILSKKLNGEVLHKYHRANSSSPTGKFIFLQKKSKLSLFLLKSDGSLVEHLAPKLYDNEIESSCFSHNEKLLAIGTAHGRVYVYSIKFKKLLYTIVLNNDYITSIDFSKEDRMIAFSSFKKNLDIYDLANSHLIFRYKHSDVITTVRFLHNSNYIVFASRDNKVYLYDYLKNTIKQQLCILIHWAIDMFIDKHDRFILVSDRSGHVHFIDLSSTQVECRVMLYEESNAVVSIKKKKEKFFFFYENGKVLVVDIKKEREEATLLYENGELDKFFEKLHKNPILKTGLESFFVNANQEFTKIFHQATAMVCIGKIKEAKKILEPFINIEDKRKKIDFLILNQDKYQKFYHLFKDKKYFEAYALSSSAEFYKEIPFYEMMENDFKKAFVRADKFLLKNNTNMARAVLEKFANIEEKKQSIVSLFKFPEKYNALEKLLRKNKLKEFYNVAQEVKYVQKSPVFQEFLLKIKDEISCFKKLLRDQNYDEAYKKGLELKAKLPEVFYQTIKEDIEKIQIQKLFIKMVNKAKFAPALNMVNEHSFLMIMNEYKKIEKFLEARLDKALKFAYLGKVEYVHKLLANFVKNSILKNRAINIYKIAYISQMEILHKKMRKKHWKKAIKNYLERFGYDGNIDEIAKKYDVDTILQKLKQTKMIGFEKLPLIVNIVKS